MSGTEHLLKIMGPVGYRSADGPAWVVTLTFDSGEAAAGLAAELQSGTRHGGRETPMITWRHVSDRGLTLGESNRMPDRPGWIWVVAVNSHVDDQGRARVTIAYESGDNA